MLIDLKVKYEMLKKCQCVSVGLIVINRLGFMRPLSPCNHGLILRTFLDMNNLLSETQLTPSHNLILQFVSQESN